MTEPHPDGYRRHERHPIGKRLPDERTYDYDEIWEPYWDEPHLRSQGERCMDCGVPTCMGGCPIGNIIPDWNDLVYQNDWKEALRRLHATNNFPEFTGYTCPAPCEDACVLAYNDDPVTIKSIERALVDKGWKEGWITPEPPNRRTGYEVAIVGSGPAGLAAAQQLNRAGHTVTVFERDDELGGLMRYGIPDFKMEKWKVQRRIDQLAAEGIEFKTNAGIGESIPVNRLREEFDASCLAVGAQRHRDLDIPGRSLAGVHYAMPYLKQANRRQAGKPIEDTEIHAAGQNVVVLGGGDTGADCVATAHRQGAEQVVQIGINPRPPTNRPADNPWPEAPKTYKKTYAQEEGGIREFEIDTLGFLDTIGDGHVDTLDAERVLWSYDEDGNRAEKQIIEGDLKIPADLVLIAIGFTGPEADPFAELGVKREQDGTFRTDATMMTTVDGIFAAGDANMGASLVVWAIGEGRDAAREIDRYLTGETDLPPSLRTPNPPISP